MVCHRRRSEGSDRAIYLSRWMCGGVWKTTRAPARNATEHSTDRMGGGGYKPEENHRGWGLYFVFQRKRLNMFLKTYCRKEKTKTKKRSQW
ncbi:hypothetical protein ES708_19224 [subsurface metagenome]